MEKRTHPDFPEYLIRDDGFVERAVDSKKYQKAGDLEACMRLPGRSALDMRGGRT